MTEQIVEQKLKLSIGKVYSANLVHIGKIIVNTIIIKEKTDTHTATRKGE